MIGKRFIRDSLIYTLAGTLPMASGIILAFFYGNLLSADLFGALSIYFGFSLLVQIIVTYSFDSSLYINFHELKSDPRKLAEFISSAFIFILTLSLVTGILLALLGNWIFSHVFPVDKILFFPFGVVSVATGIFQALFKVNNSLLQTQSKASIFFWSNLLSFSLIVGFTIIGLYVFPGDLLGPIGGRMLGVLLSATWVLSSIFRQFGFHFNWQLLKTTMNFNSTSLIYQVQQWFIGYYDRILLLAFVPLATLGYYDLALKCLMAIEFVITGLNSSFYPKVLGKVALQEKKMSTIEINRYYHGLTGVAIILVGGSIFCFPWLIQTLMPGYIKAIPLLPFVAIIYLLRPLRLFMAMPYAGVKYSKPLPIFYFIILVIKISLMYLLIKQMGVYGVLISTVVSYVIEIFILYFGIRNKFTFKLNAFKLILAPVLMALMIGLLEPLWGASHSYLLHGFYVLVGGAILLWVYWNEIKSIDIFKIVR